MADQLLPEAPTVELSPLSPKLVTLRLLTMGIYALIALLVVVGLVVLAVLTSPWVWIVAGALTVCAAALFIWLGLLIPRQVHRMGYAVRDTDLLIQRGIMFSRTTIVPFGRLQFVDVSQGPLERAFGLAGVKLHTASAGSDAEIPGLPRAKADELRELLAARGEAGLAGL